MRRISSYGLAVGVLAGALVIAGCESNTQYGSVAVGATETGAGVPVAVAYGCPGNRVAEIVAKVDSQQVWSAKAIEPTSGVVSLTMDGRAFDGWTVRGVVDQDAAKVGLIATLEKTGAQPLVFESSALSQDSITVATWSYGGANSVDESTFESTNSEWCERKGFS